MENSRPTRQRSTSQGTRGTPFDEESHESQVATVARQGLFGTAATQIPQPPLPTFIDSPLLPNAPELEEQLSSNPREDFLLSSSNLDAADLCLEAACSLLRFAVAEVWTYGGDYSAEDGKAVEPVPLHIYTRPATIDSIRSKVQELLFGDEGRVRQTLSAELAHTVRSQKEGMLWYTSAHPSTSLLADLPLNTAVALLVSLDAFRKDLCFVFFAEEDLSLQDSSASVLRDLSKAAGVALAPGFPTRSQVEMNLSMRRVGQALPTVAEDKLEPPVTEAPPKLDVRWEELRDVEFMVNGGRCTIYTAFYGSTEVVAKVVRRDTQEKEKVRRELESETSLLMKLRHPNIVRLVGVGSVDEPFLLIERLDGGTLAQRCGNATGVRDRRRRFRYKKLFTYGELLRYGFQLADAMEYLQNGAIPGKMVLHRDLKPDNIVFDVDGNLKLIDLGMGRVVTKSADDDAVYSMTGATGSLRYMSPEVALSKPYNGSADVHSFSIVLWEMTTMIKPFETMEPPDFMERVVRQDERPPISPKWPPEFSKLLSDGWHPDMYQRSTFTEIKGTLERLSKAHAASDAKSLSIPKKQDRRFGLLRSRSRAKGLVS